ncbi:MAG: Gfo/Idh/MocA family oxidoreductase [Kiritimatiellia bacterium]|jgi:predicted dehydrogenase
MKINEIGKSAKEALAYVKAIPPAQGKTMMNVPFEKRDLVRFGFIGMGNRGANQLHDILAIKGARAVAISDPREEAMLKAKEKVTQAGQLAPALEKNWQSLCERSDVDLVYICSPWELHTSQAVQAMECGKHVAVEVPCATTLADCWRLVNVSERTRRHCVILENCCYGKQELTVLNLVRKGRFGTLTHGEAAYIHDLRSELVASQSEGLWRRKPHMTRNGNLYPTHGLGPVAWYMDIHHGDRFARLVSMSSREAALSEYRDATLSAADPRRLEKYTCGDMNTSLIQTANGRTIMLQHDVVTPRPYSRLNLIQGTKGIFSDYPPRVFFDGQKKHDWYSYDTIEDAYEHPLWKKHGAQALKLGGHGGMDYIMNYRLVQTYRRGLPPDLNVYDAAAWSAPGPLSDISVAWDNLPLPFPDFTRGNWRQTGSAPLA